MAATSGIKSGNLIGGISGRPTAPRPTAKDLPPAVRDGLRQLLQEAETVRLAPVQFRRKSEDDAIALKPCVDRDGFIRELARISSFVQRYAVPAGIIYVRLEKLDSIAERHGAAAVHAAVSRVAAVLASQVRETDVVGCLGRDDFGVLLAKATLAEAAAKAEMLSGLIKASPIVWDGRAIALSVTSGAETLAVGP